LQVEPRAAPISPYKRWAMLLFMPLWPNHTWVRITCIFSTRVYILVCTRSCMSIASLYNPLRSLAAVIKNYFGPSQINPSWLNLLSAENSNIWYIN